MTKGDFEKLVNDIIYHVKGIDLQTGGALILTTTECTDVESKQISNVILHGNNQNIANAMCLMAEKDERWNQVFIQAVVTMFIRDDNFRNKITRAIQALVKK